jgi:hypothetical protein
LKGGDSHKVVLTLFYTHNLDLQICFSKMMMVHKFEVVLHKENESNPITRLWCKISTFVVFNHKLFEYFNWLKLPLSKSLGMLKVNEILAPSTL